MKKLTLNSAKQLIDAAEKEATNIDVQMVISIVDDGGNLIATHRMDDAWLASIDVAVNKAWTSVALKTETAALADATVPNQELYGLNTTNQGKIVVFGGGIPLVRDGEIVGAVGVSGGAVNQDIQVAEAAVNAFAETSLA